MRHFLLVGTSRRVTTAVLQGIRSQGDEHCTVIGGGDTGALRWSSLCSDYTRIAFDGSDDARFIDMARTLARQQPHAAVIAVDCDGIRLVNRVREALTMPVAPIPDTVTLDRFDDKWQFYQFCVQHRLSVPATIAFDSKHQINFAVLAATLGLPVVLKPVNGAGSVGVCVIHDCAQFEREVLHNAQYDFAPLIAQRYIEGEDVDLSLFAVHGQLAAFAIQKVVGAEIRFVRNAQLEEIAHKLPMLARFHGVMHIDARVEQASGKVYLIESNPRFWASLTASAWCGLNFVAESVNRSEGMTRIRRLVTGTAHLRHPLLRPACWREMLTSSGKRGRLLRAMSLDAMAMGQLLRDVPAMGGRLWQRAELKWNGHPVDRQAVGAEGRAR